MTDPSLPPCPTCHQPAHRETTVGGFTCYACDNEHCEHFPATSYHPDEREARAQWEEICKANENP